MERKVEGDETEEDMNPDRPRTSLYPPPPPGGGGGGGDFTTW